MKKAIKHLFDCLISTILIISVAIMPTLNVFSAEAAGEDLYVKNVIFIYAENKDDALAKVPEGYKMLPTDLNQGAAYVFAVDDVYLAYSTTSDPSEAITDIKMMNMNGGFVLSDYNEQINNVSENVKQMARELKAAVDVFRSNYQKGTPGAKAAYLTLDAFTVDEMDNMTLANYFIYETVPDSFYLKLLLNAHNNIISAILSALTMAVQGAPGDTWIDRLAKIDDPDSIFDDSYWDQATALQPHFAAFFEAYDAIDHDLFYTGSGEILDVDSNDGSLGGDISNSGNTSDVALSGNEILYEIAYSALDAYSFGNGIPLSEWLVNDYIYEEMLYPLIKVLSPAEYAMMHLCGPLYMILATSMSDSVYADYTAELNETLRDMGSCSVWHGVNTELFHSSIGITDEASRAIAETKAEQEFNNDGSSNLDDTIKFAGLIASVGAISLGTGLIALSYTAGALGAILTGSTASSIAVATAIAGSLCVAAGVIVICVALVIAVIYMVVWIKNWYDQHHPEYTEIPEYMYDMVTDKYENRQFVLYEVARSSEGKPVDVNAWEGSQWHAPYISRDSAAGNPIKADFKIKLGDGRVDEGYAPLASFGSAQCENLNKYADDDDVNGIFVSFRQESLDGAFARGKYLSDMRLFSDSNPEKCKANIENQRYTVYNINLTPDADYCTYIGYKTTNRPNLALTDIRITYGYSSTQYSAGGAGKTYAASGSTGGLTLYTTRISIFGSPILSDFIILEDRNAPAGFEPVNHFHGGPAVNLYTNPKGHVDRDSSAFIYFLPSRAYTGGTEYLGGIATAYSFIERGFTQAGGPVSDAIKDLGYKALMQVSGNAKTSGALLYTTTYNPYRAIYGITATSNGDCFGQAFVETLNYDQISYSLATRYIIDNDDNLRYEYMVRDNDSRLYVSGVGKSGSPMKVGDLVASGSPDNERSGFIPVSAALTTSTKAVDLSRAFNYIHEGTYSSVRDFEMDPIYLFIRSSEYVEGQYVTNLFLASRNQLTANTEIECGAVDYSYVINALASQGGHTLLQQNLNLEDSTNSTYLAYTKNKSSRTPITDVILYYAGKTNKDPEPKIVHNKITYHLVCDLNLFCEENGENKTCKRVYLYYTSNPAAGEPILDIKIDNKAILDGWETVVTQNGKALHVDMDKFPKSMWYLHLKREAHEPEYISEIHIGWGSETEAMAMLLEKGCNYVLSKDLNDGCGPASDYVYLGYNRTSDIDQAIRDLRTTHDDNVDSFKKNGATYKKIPGNLNSYTYLFADDIYLYYSKDEKAGAPLVSLTTSSSKVSKSNDGLVSSTVVQQNDNASDLNDGAMGDYIYLIQTKDENSKSEVASMLGSGSIAIMISFSVMSCLCALTIYGIQRRRRLSDNAKQNDRIQ